MSQRKLSSCALVMGLLITFPVAARDCMTDPIDLEIYRGDLLALADAPGSSNSLAGGLYNPAVWGMQPGDGLYFSWLADDLGVRARGSWLGILKRKRLAFAMDHFVLTDAQGREDHLDEYTVALTSGDGLTNAAGISYSWSKCGELLRRSRRLGLGSLYRWQHISLGSMTSWDLCDGERSFIEADVGVRPLGPRLTFFADAIYDFGEDFDRIQTGYGCEVLVTPDISLAGKQSNDGDYSVRLELGLTRRLRGSARAHMDRENEHVGTTYAIESRQYRTSLAKTVGLEPLSWSRSGSYPEIKLNGSMTYRRYRFFDDRRTFISTLHRIDWLAEDPDVDGVLLNLSGMRINSEMLWELRKQLAGLRAHGKEIVVYCDRLGLAGYMLASVADQIWMDPEGGLSIRGLSAGRTYLKNMLDKAGIGFEEHRYFTYKSAAESFARTSMSPADREQRQALIDDYYAAIAGVVGQSRGISRSAWDDLVNEQYDLTAAEALAAGLVDSVGSFSDARKATRKAEPRTTEDHYAADLGTIFGDRDWRRYAWGEADRIAVLYGIGGCSMDAGIKGPVLAAEIKRAREDRRVKAVVLRADSPGGQRLPSDLVAREMALTAKVKPVIVSQGRVAASGGYWISMRADSILATPLTLTGSVGTISAHAWDAGFGEKLGLSYDKVKRGAHADVYSGPTIPLLGVSIPNRALTDEEHERVEEVIRRMYHGFVASVAECRGMTWEETDQIAQGRVWSGTAGLANGLVDELGGLWDAIRIAKEAAGLPEDHFTRLVQGPSLGWINPSFFNISPFGEFAEPVLATGHPGEDDPWAVDPTHSSTRVLLGEEAFRGLPATERHYLEYLLAAQGEPLLLMDPIEIASD